ncbi:MAG: hypothetical protein FWD68_19770 [Alphaproteobacteria bacterium]|nr:hypothetical protein [Alphaproteobacteria bacterium]
MGLEILELIFDVKRKFQVTLSEDDCKEAFSDGGKVGDLYGVVLARLAAIPGRLTTRPGCMTSKAFYRTRRALVSTLGIPRHAIRPSTGLGLLFPDDTRKEQWEKFRATLGLVVPSLRIVGNQRQKISGLTFGFVLHLAGFFAILALLDWSVPVAIFTAVFWLFVSAGITLVRLSKPKFAIELPVDTAGELARVVLSGNRDRFLPERTGGFAREDVWHCLVDMICDVLDVEPHQVVPKARFVEDLGAG